MTHLGLFGTLTGIFTGTPVNLWSPAAFVKDPARWLTEFAATGSTVSTMPNFAFDALVDAVPPERARELDLSAWRVCFNGAEIIRADSLAAFAERFAPAGFRPATMTPGFRHGRGHAGGHPPAARARTSCSSPAGRRR